MYVYVCVGGSVCVSVLTPPLQGGEAGPQYLPPDTELLTGKSRRDV